MDLRIVSGDRSTSAPGGVAVSAAPRDQSGSGASARGTVEDVVFLTVSVAGTQRSYTYAMPDDAVLAAAVASIVAAPKASLASQAVSLRETAVSLLSPR